mgnify:FL=1
MIKAIEKNLQRGIKLLHTLSDEEYSNSSVAPYYSSIGCHIRHVLDAFRCIFEGIDKGEIDFTNRVRNTVCEVKTENGLQYFNDIIFKLNNTKNIDLSRVIKVKDNLGTGIIEVNYTLESTLAYAHSHAIHHFASIGFLIYQLGIELSDEDFGFNPTTPKLKA